MAEKKLGTDKIKDCLGFVFSICNATGETLEDGSVSFTDIPHWIPVVSKFSEAVESFVDLWPQVEDLDKAEIEELRTWGEKEFDIPQDQFEAYFEMAYGVMLNLVKLYTQFQKAS